MANSDIVLNIVTKGAQLAKQQLGSLGNASKGSANNLAQLNEGSKVVWVEGTEQYPNGAWFVKTGQDVEDKTFDSKIYQVNTNNFNLFNPSPFKLLILCMDKALKPRNERQS